MSAITIALSKGRIFDETVPLLTAAPDVAMSLNNLAALYLKQGQYREVEPLCVRALGILEQELGPHHPQVAASLENLAELYKAQGRYGEAEPLYVRTLDIREKALGSHHPDVAASLSHLATFYLAQKDVDRAITYEERAEHASDNVLSAMMRHGSEQHKHAYLAKDLSKVDMAVTLALRTPGDARAQRLAMRYLLHYKGRVLDAMRQRSRWFAITWTTKGKRYSTNTS